MADEMDDVYDDEMPEDTAAGLTSGVVIMTFVVLLAAIIVMFMANGKWFEVGPFAN